jgi:hypothetical protein
MDEGRDGRAAAPTKGDERAAAPDGTAMRLAMSEEGATSEGDCDE